MPGYDEEVSTVVAAVTDLFFLAKIQDAIKKAGLEMKLAKSTPDALEKVRAGARLLILDLNDRNIAPLELLANLNSDESLRSVPAVCFLAHVQTDLKKQAQEAGADEVLARSIFSTSLPAVLDRYTR